MKIAFLNPWKNAAENQAFRSLEIAAARIGHELIHCVNSDELEAVRPEFVLAAASTQPKLTNCPTYGVIHEPRDRFLSRAEYFRNLLSYDGYLTISDTLRIFLTHLLFGLGRPARIGYYYNSCQQNTPDAQFLQRLEEGKVKLTYFGTNWERNAEADRDKQRVRLCQLVSDLDDVEIYGPAKSWEDINPKAYKGLLPFDGCSVQEKYRQNGIGLVLLFNKHLADDVISNRIFEITSVGAIAVCCRTKWIEEAFGDSVYYFDQGLPERQMIDQIASILAQIRSDPRKAYRRAQQAHRIFTERFSAEKLLQNAIDYHLETVTETRGVGVSSRDRPPLISVIVRCGGRPIEILRRAVRSIAAQRFGRFQLILVRYRPLELESLLSEFRSRLESIVCVDCFGGHRSAALWCGLGHVQGEYFSILDDDDEFMPDHFRWLFHSDGVRDVKFIYTGSIRVSIDPEKTEEGNLERRRICTFGISQCKSFFDQSGFFSNNCFVASSSLLSDHLLVDPGLKTAEDSYLILSLLAQSEPVFNFRATAIQHESAGNSDFRNEPDRLNDVLNLYLRLLTHYGQAPHCADAHDLLRHLERRVRDESASQKASVPIPITTPIPSPTPALPVRLSSQSLRQAITGLTYPKAGLLVRLARLLLLVKHYSVWASFHLRNSGSKAVCERALRRLRLIFKSGGSKVANGSD